MAYLDLNGLKYFLNKLKPKLVPAGAVQAFGGKTAPAGWLVCNGQAVSRTTYSALFSAIGTIYGSGDGRTTFNLPNLGGYTIIGGNSGDVGRKIGESSHQNTIAEMANHDHPIGDTSGNGYWRFGGSTNALAQPGVGQWGYKAFGVQAQGGGQAHNNIQPSVYMTYIIKI